MISNRRLRTHTRRIHYIKLLLLSVLITSTSWLALALTFTTTTTTNNNDYVSPFSGRRNVIAIPTQQQTVVVRRRRIVTQLYATRLRTNIEIPLIDLTDQTTTSSSNTTTTTTTSSNNKNDNDDEISSVIPLPSSDLPDELATPFLYAIQMNIPLYKLVMEESISMASSSSPPMYGHVVWKNNNNLLGAIGCTAIILGNPPTKETLIKNIGNSPLTGEEILTESSFSAEEEKSSLSNIDDNKPSSSSSSSSNTFLCRGGWRFVVKEVIRSIPYPVVIVDEIHDDADDDDSDMFASVGNNALDKHNDYDDDDNDDDGEFSQMSTPELIHRIMTNVQSIIGEQLEDANAKSRLSPLEKSILEDNGIGGPSGTINPAVIELAHAEEMSAVWEVFQSCLVDDIDPQQRRFAVAMMSAELANLTNNVRQKILLTRSSEERLNIVLRELNEITGMRQARKLASKITDEIDELDKDLKVGRPELPLWALQISKGTKIEYFWNEIEGWCPGVVIEDPVTVVDEIILAIRFDEDGEVHKLPISAEDKIRWRPG